MSNNRQSLPNLRWLETYLAIIENEGVEAKAAKALGVSASVVNRHAAALENWLSQPLFQSGFPRVQTDFGVIFATTVKEIFTLLTDARALPPKRTLPRHSAKDIKLKPHT